MGTMLIVIKPPRMGGFPHLVKVAEQVKAQELLAVRTVEPFNIGVLVRLARLDVPDGHPIIFRKIRGTPYLIIIIVLFRTWLLTPQYTTQHLFNPCNKTLAAERSSGSLVKTKLIRLLFTNLL